ncbi:hypothetical protein QNI16_34795 [Cytophagaceae bacterium YF14B1]|uniref:Uncharacterized protein n=1 Tax=Xanthocytophaga flava TaxID=3048013 RepID=A0AAE3UAM8_9BACT|nr:hypothetical protein [Xanthocytophaga flavus]MDJ1485701.1 hypothetical protein [Xanthocytophaga flavus]
MEDYSITRTQAEQKIRNWQQCYSSGLVNHFNKSNGLQFERLCSLELPLFAIDQAFPANDQANDPIDFNIMMGLDSIESNSEKFTFIPVIQSSGAPDKFFEFQHIEADPSVIPTITQIPYELFDWLSKNWREMEFETVNDVFEAKLEGHSMIKLGSLKRLVRKRLLGYYFTKNINPVFWKVINDSRGHIRKIVFHLGADMNKEKHYEMFTFSPIFELVLNTDNIDETKLILTIHKLGLRSIKQEDGSTSIFYEYTSPCPSSCPT